MKKKEEKMTQKEELEFINNLINAFKAPRNYRPLTVNNPAPNVPRKTSKFKIAYAIFYIAVIISLFCFALSISDRIFGIISVTVCFAMMYDILFENRVSYVLSPYDLYFNSRNATRNFLDQYNFYIDFFNSHDAIFLGDPKSDRDIHDGDKYEWYPTSFFPLLQYAYATNQFDEAKAIIQHNDRLPALSKVLNKIQSYKFAPQNKQKYGKLCDDYQNECKRTVKELADLLKPSAIKEADRIMQKNDPDDVALLPDRYQKQAVNNFVNNL